MEIVIKNNYYQWSPCGTKNTPAYFTLYLILKQIISVGVD